VEPIDQRVQPPLMLVKPLDVRAVRGGGVRILVQPLVLRQQLAVLQFERLAFCFEVGGHTADCRRIAPPHVNCWRIVIPQDTVREPEPRWHALLALCAVGGLYVALPSYLVVGPRWWFPIVIGVLLVGLIVTHRAGRTRLNVLLGTTVTTVMTAALIVSVALLVVALPSKRETPVRLLLSAGSIWVTNIVVFALWYWRLDAGGPHLRDRRQQHTSGSFLFPQMTMLPEVREATEQTGWSPQFIDYLFLAFNTSTAFSPTDTPVLTRWAKIIMMMQSVISLTVLALLAARAINIL
jgi:hypothetical protein